MKNRLKPFNQYKLQHHIFVQDQLIQYQQMNKQNQSGGVVSLMKNHKVKQHYAKKFRTIRKHLSRTSNLINMNKQLIVVKLNHNENDNTGKSGGDDSEASSVGEEVTQLSFTEVPTSNTELTDTESSTAIH